MTETSNMTETSHMTETYTLTLTCEQRDTLVDCIDRASEDFEYASGFKDNGYSEKDIKNLWKRVESLQTAIRDATDEQWFVFAASDMDSDSENPDSEDPDIDRVLIGPIKDRVLATKVAAALSTSGATEARMYTQAVLARPLEVFLDSMPLEEFIARANK